MTRPTHRRAFLLGTSALAVAIVSGRDARAGDPLGDVTRAREGMRSLVAKFEQTRVIGLLAQPVTSKGELTVVPPTDLRWELFAPDATVYWINKDGAFVKSGSSGKATRAPSGSFGAVLSDMMTFIAGDMKKLESRYALDAAANADGSVKIVAKPKSADLEKIVRRIELVTNTDKWGVARVVIEEASGDSSTIVFEKNVRDAKVDAAKMKPS
ncbi:MAG TPA: outer membrane lipoprotein carrier protein LolA [Polyangiaceae bacterium]|jgi:outer membrane lipoprotein-sorting protein|nr:outer membrane lipoprotein carrier protein LolA [Polyangiaceae bacterium]